MGGTLINHFIIIIFLRIYQILSTNKYLYYIMNLQCFESCNHCLALGRGLTKSIKIESIALLMILMYLIVPSTPIQLVEMIPLQVNGSQHPVAMYNKSNQTQPYNQSFIEISSSFNCSLSILYTVQQNQSELAKDSPYNITIIGITKNTTVSITPVYNTITPTINGSSTAVTIGPQNLAILNIRNGCPTNTGFFNYFDRVQLFVEGLDTFTYNVLCNSQFKSSTFEIGLLIEILLSSILIVVVAIYSKAWSLGGQGFTVNILFIIVFNCILVIGGIVAAFSLTALNIILIVLACIFGSLAVALCINQLLFLIKLNFLKKGFKIKNIEIRVMEIISLILGIGSTFGWYFSDKNWLVNDLLAVSMIVAAIKIFKITSFKIAIIGFTSVLLVQIIFILVLQLALQVSYNNAILNLFNNPFELQFPTINPVYNQKCSWLPITAIAYPGAVMAYMRRFDTSRNTCVYLLTCGFTFVVGSVIWMFISIASPFSIPFGLLAEPAMIGLVALFAWKRRQIRTLWTGKFYDEEYANKESLKNIVEMMNDEQDKETAMKKSLFNGLYVGDSQSIYEGSVTSSPMNTGKKLEGQQNNNKSQI